MFGACGKKVRNNLICDKNDCVFLLMMLIIAVTVLMAVCYLQGNVHLCINDNLDSNIPSLKMIKDNSLFLDFEEQIPFLHGDVTRAEYPILLSATAWIYMVFDPLPAYYIVRFISYFFSAFGFWWIGKEIDRPNAYIYGVCGIIYGLIGTWPHAALAFAAIPLWVACFCSLYMQIYKKEVYLFLPIFPVLMNFALI